MLLTPTCGFPQVYSCATRTGLPCCTVECKSDTPQAKQEKWVKNIRMCFFPTSCIYPLCWTSSRSCRGQEEQGPGGTGARRNRGQEEQGPGGTGAGRNRGQEEQGPGGTGARRNRGREEQGPAAHFVTPDCADTSQCTNCPLTSFITDTWIYLKKSRRYMHGHVFLYKDLRRTFACYDDVTTTVAEFNFCISCLKNKNCFDKCFG